MAVSAAKWLMKLIYQTSYFPHAIPVWALGWLGMLPGVRRSTQGECDERRYFYGTVWAMCIAQPVLWILYLLLPRHDATDILELVVYVGLLAVVAYFSYRGSMPRTQKICAGEIAERDSCTIRHPYACRAESVRFDVWSLR